MIIKFFKRQHIKYRLSKVTEQLEFQKDWLKMFMGVNPFHPHTVEKARLVEALMAQKADLEKQLKS